MPWRCLSISKVRRVPKFAARPSSSPGSHGGLRLAHAIPQKPRILEGLSQILQSMASGALLLVTQETEGYRGRCYGPLHASNMVSALNSVSFGLINPHSTPVKYLLHVEMEAP